MLSTAREARWRLPAGLAAAALWLLATIGLRPLAIPDEGRYVGVAWEMLHGGQWLVPTLDGLPFFHKPPLFYWLAAAAMQVFGPLAWAARLGSWAAAVATMLGLYFFLRRWSTANAARNATLVLATLPLFYGGAQYANMDMLVAGCIACCLLAAAHATLAAERGEAHRGALAAAFVLAAAGVLAKGLIGVVLPLSIWLAWGGLGGRWRTLRRLLLWLPGWLLFAAIVLPWFVAVQARHPGFAHYFFIVQHVERFASTGFNNPQPRWFYPVLLLATALPWSPWLLALARRGYWRRADPAGLRALMLLWLGGVTLFFSLPQSKLVGYILPAVPPLAWLIADAMAFAGAGRQRRRLPVLTVVLAAALCAGAVVAAHYRQPKSEQLLAERLAAERHPGEPVVYAGRYFYDVAFYARLQEPVLVVDAWSAAAVAQDSWRRELSDAAAFDNAAPRRLLRPEQLPAALCGAALAWYLASWPNADPALVQAPLVHSADAALWRLRPAPCAVTAPTRNAP